MISAEDLKKANQIIQRLTPTEKQYKLYLNSAHNFIKHFDKFKKKQPTPTQVFRLELVNSKYFSKIYLVSFVSKEWFCQIAPSFDAAATSEFIFVDQRAPPLIVNPGKSISKKSGFLSILEHEFVHVNQAIVGQLPNLDSCKVEKNILFKELIKHTFSEYEAHFVQLAYDPTLMPPAELGLNLDEWCHLRGFTSGLERLLGRMIFDQTSQQKINDLIKMLESDLPEAFKESGLSLKIGQSYADDIHRMVKIAVGIILKK